MNPEPIATDLERFEEPAPVPGYLTFSAQRRESAHQDERIQ